MKIDILTLFPEMFEGPFRESIIKRAQDKLLVKIETHNLRDWAIDSRGTVDDRPYGGGVGMILMVEPIDRALRDLKIKSKKAKVKTTTQNSKVILLSPQGKAFNQKMAQKLAKMEHLILICGHYEGVDERVSEHLADGEISIGDYVLTGGEIPAMVVTDTVVRLIPGVIEKPEAIQKESFSCSNDLNHDNILPALKSRISPLKENVFSASIHPHNKLWGVLEASNNKPLLEHPQYTRPEDYQGFKVPKILLSGNHEEIAKWREKEALKKTKKRRPDLLK